MYGILMREVWGYFGSATSRVWRLLRAWEDGLTIPPHNIYPIPLRETGRIERDAKLMEVRVIS